ncbi:MAG TPA: bifunctional diaminohydroxyphosphoribosylaminopyrimidine deaminase/5-amino-6-(5-phosphoribosylamino)uracil reductase RibD, partial [Gemmataceae bacterium]|nr:bifunctional diaminohydroxyphosphoribosylaminopyrimidine deaminase/5-amino-6-(5-phosphoribosylamino)uracil reductase RibD [Gemmataceae bacterium]
QRCGQAHAEVNALAAAGGDARGATLYVTLEPCCHHGKTPPCTDAILRAGVARVVAAMSDPFPEVAGKGADQLRQAGVAVEFGVGEAAARRLNAPYLTLLATKMPYVHAKWAMTLDGKIATRTGDSKWISNEASRRRCHVLRGRMDAVIVGVGTALADDPQLTARPPGPRTPVRIILDSKCRLPTHSVLARTAREVPTLLATTTEAPAERVAALRALGCEVLTPPLTPRPLPPGERARGEGAGGRTDVMALLAELGRRRMTNALVEGGSGVLGSFLDAGVIDEVHVSIAPCLAGGAEARTPVGGRGVEKIAEALRLTETRVEVLDGDVFVHGWR